MDRRIRWNNKEWLLVCKWLLEHYPIICKSSSTLAGISVEELDLAQRSVLTSGSWRNLWISNRKKTIGILLPHMDSYKKTIVDQDALEKEKLEQQLLLNKHLVDLICSQLYDSFLPCLEKKMEQLVEKCVRKTLVEMIGSAQDKANLLIEQKAEIDKLIKTQNRKPRVGIIGTLPIQSESLANSFPNLDFIRIDKKLDNAKKQAVQKAVKGCDFVFGMLGKMSVNIHDDIIEKVVGQGFYKKVPGSTSALKREIQFGLDSNKIFYRI